MWDRQTIELSKVASIAVEHANIKPGENVVLITETSHSARIADAFMGAVFAAGGNVCAITIPTRPTYRTEPPAPVAAAMKTADVLIDLSKVWIVFTKAAEEAQKAGARFLDVSEATEEMLIRMMLNLDYEKMDKRTEIMAELLNKAKVLRITSSIGTDIMVELKPESAIAACGYVSKPGEYSGLPGNTAYAGSMHDTANGVLAVDGTIDPGTGLLSEPVKLTFESGKITKIGGGRQAEEFRKWIDSFNDPYMYYFDHIGVGFNPNAKLESSAGIGERVLGYVEVGIGLLLGKAHSGKPNMVAKSHTDCIIISPSLYLDGELILENRKFIHPSFP